jgi:hypothetical protein
MKKFLVFLFLSCCIFSYSSESKGDWLFIFSAESAKFNELGDDLYELVLDGKDSVITAFTKEPEKKVAMIESDTFFSKQFWEIRPDSFEETPPIASIVGVDQGGKRVTFIVEINYRDGKIEFTTLFNQGVYELKDVVINIVAPSGKDWDCILEWRRCLYYTIYGLCVKPTKEELLDQQSCNK